MNLFLLWSTTILILIGIYLLAKYFIKKYFESKKGKFDPNKSNYISSLAITAILASFTILNPKANQYIINFCIEILNKSFDFNIMLINVDIDMYDLLLYVIFCSTISLIIFLSYRHRTVAYQKFLDEKRESNIVENEIKFPKQNYNESPYLHERVRDLFELKFKNYNLSLKETVNDQQNKILYGNYEDDFNTIFQIIYCESEKNDTIKETQINEIVAILENKFKELSKDKRKPIPHFYLISEKGKFLKDKSNDKIICLSEDDYINSLIDFRRYLTKLISKFENEKIFSALLNENERKTLADTYIEPLFNIGEILQENNKKSLIAYVKKWLEESHENKHLVILGDYGMGKTSFLKHFSANIAREILDDGKISRFPVFIQLTNTSPIHGGIHSAIKSFVADNLGVEYDLFMKLVEKGKVLFLLDAYDEMGFIGTNQQRFKQFNEIWQLAIKNNKILLTGRPSYFPTEFELKSTLAIPQKGHEGFQTRPYAERIILKKLEDTQIGQYIEKYYPTKGQQYLRWIRNNNKLHELCKRPSMMHIIREMLPEMHENASNAISAGDMMKQYIEYWINRQDRKEIQSAFEGNPRKKLEFILSFFKDLSVELYLSNKTKMNSEEILKYLNLSIEFYHLPGFNNKDNLEGFQQEILAGYFIERENDSFKFAHKSFYEYFVSSKIIELIKKRDFKNPLMFANWNLEIIDFIYDTIPESHRNNKNMPSLLSFANSKFMAKIKLSLFKLDVLFNRFMANVSDTIYQSYSIY